MPGMCFTHKRLLYERDVQRSSQALDTDRSNGSAHPPRRPIEASSGPESAGVFDLQPSPAELIGARVRVQA